VLYAAAPAIAKRPIRLYTPRIPSTYSVSVILTVKAKVLQGLP
jgi:hypothetical protein